MLLHHDARRPVQADNAPVAAEVAPHLYSFGERGRGERLDGGETFEEREVEGDRTLHLYLLQHHLGDEDAVGVARASPGQVPPVLLEPGDDGTAYGLDLGGVRSRRVAGSLFAHPASLRTRGAVKRGTIG